MAILLSFYPGSLSVSCGQSLAFLLLSFRLLRRRTLRSRTAIARACFYYYSKVAAPDSARDLRAQTVSRAVPAEKATLCPRVPTYTCVRACFACRKLRARFRGRTLFTRDTRERAREITDESMNLAV